MMCASETRLANPSVNDNHYYLDTSENDYQYQLNTDENSYYLPLFVK